MEKIKFSLTRIRQFKADHINFVRELIAEHGPAIALQGPFYNLHILASPGYIKHVLFENYTNYVRPPIPS